MGQGRSLVSTSEQEPVPSNINNTNNCVKDNDEYAHLGSVSVKLSWLTANVRYTPEHQNDIVVTGKGGVFHGASSASPAIMKGKRMCSE